MRLLLLLDGRGLMKLKLSKNIEDLENGYQIFEIYIDYIQQMDFSEFR
jgi:hypothetical protein